MNSGNYIVNDTDTETEIQFKDIINRKAYMITGIINPTYYLSQHLCKFTGRLPDGSMITIKYASDCTYEKFLNNVLICRGIY